MEFITMSKHLTQNQSRRHFLGTGAAIASTALLGSLPLGSVNAQSQTGGEGYQTLETPIPTRDAERIEVLEFFWFGCPHCYAFEPVINKWVARKPDYVDFLREAPPLNPSWEQHSRAFYAAEALGITHGFFDTMFNTIHKDRKPMREPAQIAKLVESLDLGADADKFEKAMTSFSVQTALTRSMNIARGAQVTGVPSILVNGKYMTGNSIAAGVRGGVIAVIDQLVAREHAAS